MKEALINLLKVKSIVTILLTAIVCYLAVVGRFDVHDIYITIIAFYFGTQHQKNGKITENSEKNIEDPENVVG